MGRRVLKQKNPQHLAIVMDGNGRWAAQRGLNRIEGHRQGVQVVRKVIECCLQSEIKVLSLFTFSHENWSRPRDEINFLMELFLNALNHELPELHQHGIQLRFLGSQEGLNHILIQQMRQAENFTKHNHQLILNIALNYSGKWDILNAVKKVVNSDISIETIDESMFSSFLSTADLPNPDLLIRTSGEKRISNFFLWQLAYTELFFCDVMWPDFNEDNFKEALIFFNTRERRFGKTSQQLQDSNYV